MKITSIDALQLPSGNKGATTRGAWSPVLVRVNTDEVRQALRMEKAGGPAAE